MANSVLGVFMYEERGNIDRTIYHDCSFTRDFGPWKECQVAWSMRVDFEAGKMTRINEAGEECESAIFGLYTTSKWW